jgi:hypothetical protein
MNRREIADINHTVPGLCKLARMLGYKDPFSQLINNDGSVVGDLLDFFDDNSGACEAVIEWVLERGCHSDGTPIEDEDEDDEDYEDD